MRKTVSSIVAMVATAFLSILVSCPAQGDQTANLIKTRRAASTDVVPGYWHASLSKCRTYAEQHGVPLIAVWSNGEFCGHCIQFESACNTTQFKNWMPKFLTQQQMMILNY